MNELNNAERLYEIGFQTLGVWVRDGGYLKYELTPDDANSRIRLEAGAALYAFVCGGSVLYLGKTSINIASRFVGYKRPAKKQSTNVKCHEGILECIKQHKIVEILTLSGVSQLRWGEFELNIAAGLEDSLIAELDPPWNGKAGKPVTESAMIEEEALHLDKLRLKAPPLQLAGLPIFKIKLGDKYYHDGFINPGVDVSHFFGKDRDTLLLRLGADDARGVETYIDRKANKTGSPRIYGRKQTARWFQEHFKLGDIVDAVIINPNEVVLTLPQT